MTKDEIASNEAHLVLFELDNQTYGIEVASVEEIIRMQTITEVPAAPPFVEGVINLRGKVIPVLDLRKRLGLPPAEFTMNSRIIVVTISGKSVGLIADTASDVLRIPASSLEPTSDIIMTDDSDYILGIAKLDNIMVILLNIENIIPRKSIVAVQDESLMEIADTEANYVSKQTPTGTIEKEDAFVLESI